MAQSANRVSKELGIVPPAIIGVWHSSTKENPWGRGKDLVPEKYFRDGISVAKDVSVPSDHPDFLHGDTYLRSIFEEYVPAIAPAISPSHTAMIGSSMGGLATLYAIAQLPDKFTTALALSTHWPFGGNELVERTIKELPSPTTHKIWMSHGTKGLDSAYVPFQHLADKLMAERGYLPHNFVSKVYERSGHNERSWAKYLDQPMRFWLSS
jgi:predicted alpha/beta superfamily hydrolase